MWICQNKQCTKLKLSDFYLKFNSLLQWNSCSKKLNFHWHLKLCENTILYTTKTLVYVNNLLLFFLLNILCTDLLCIYLIILPWKWSIIYLCLRCVLFDKTLLYATLGGLEHVLNVHVRQSCKYELRCTDVLSRSRKHLFIGSVETLTARNNRSIRSGGLWV